MKKKMKRLLALLLVLAMTLSLCPVVFAASPAEIYWGTKNPEATKISVSQSALAATLKSKLGITKTYVRINGTGVSNQRLDNGNVTITLGSTYSVQSSNNKYSGYSDAGEFILKAASITPKTEPRLSFVYGETVASEADVFNAIVQSSTPSLTASDVTVLYYTGAAKGYQNLDYTALTGLAHNFGKNKTEYIQINYKNGTTECGTLWEGELSIVDDRVTFNDPAELNYFKNFDPTTHEPKGTKADLEAAALDALLKDPTQDTLNLKNAYDNGLVSIQYFIGNAWASTLDFVVENDELWKDLDYELDNGGFFEKLLSYGLSLIGRTMEDVGLHRFGIHGVGSSELVRITYKGKDASKPGEWTKTLLMADQRAKTQITIDYTNFEELLSRVPAVGKVFPVIYGDKDYEKAQILNRVSVSTIEGGKRVYTTADDFEIDPEQMSVKLLQKQQVEIQYAGSEDYAPCSLKFDVYVLPAAADLDVDSLMVTYGEEYKLVEKIHAKPETLNYMTVIAGIDGDATGYLSVDFPSSVRKLMKIQLTPDMSGFIGGRISEIISGFISRIGGEGKIQETIDSISGNLGLNIKAVLEDGVWYLDLYETMKNMIGEDGISLADFSGLADNLSKLANNEWIGAALENAGFNVESFKTAADALKALDGVSLNMKVYLDKAPVNAGVYIVTAVSTDLNYLPCIGVGQLTILPQTEGVSLKWNEEMTSWLDHVIPYEEAQTFDFEGALYVDDVKRVDDPHVHSYFGGIKLENLSPDFDNDPIRKPGAYAETLFVFGGNYWDDPLFRAYVIDRMDTVISVENVETTYNGQPQTEAATANVTAEGKSDHVSLTDQLSFYYSGRTAGGMIYQSTTAPKDAGEYIVTVTFAGDTLHDVAVKFFKLTINPKTLTITANNRTGWVDYPLDFTAEHYTVSGLVGGDVLLTPPTPSYGPDFALGKPGTYTITLSGAYAGPNYTFTYKDATLEYLEDGFIPLLSRILNYNLYDRFVDVPFNAYYTDAVNWALDNEITEGVDYNHFMPEKAVTRGQFVTFLWRAAGKPYVNYAMNMTDVAEGAYYTEAVRWALATGIAKGTSETTFSPDAVCTRAHVVTFLARYAGIGDGSAQTSFTDVKSTDYFAAAVYWAVVRGVTTGTSATTFSPNAFCTRAQVVTFLYRLLGR